MPALFLAFCTAAFAQETPATQPSELIKPATTAGPVERPEDADKPMITLQKGDLPIILSAPHGGRKKIPGSAVRTGKNILIKKGSKSTFTMAFDQNVDVIALKLADELEKRTGKRPYLVVANFTRRNADANRGPEDGFEDAAGEAVWNQYHDAIKAYRKDIQEKFNHRGLLLDIHGNAVGPDVVIRGTANWTSDKHLTEEFGKEAVIGPTGLFAGLAKDPAYKLMPPIDKPDEPEYERLNGGYITREYGSYQGGTFDAVQLELGTAIRKPENLDHFVTALADGLVPFMYQYLLVPAEAAKK